MIHEKGGTSWHIHVKIVVQLQMNLVIFATHAEKKPGAAFVASPKSIQLICVKTN
jgi:hypothetical protein